MGGTSAMSKPGLIYLALLIMAFALTACEISPAITASRSCRCDQLPGADLGAHILKQFSSEEFLVWIETTYRVPNENVLVNKEAEEMLNYTWEANGVRYMARVVAGTLVAARAETTRNPVPSAACVVSCIGAPGQYRAYFTRSTPGRQLEFEMVFPTQGTWVGGTQFFGLSQEQPPAIGGAFPMNFFRYETPGTEKAILQKVYGDGNIYETVQRQFKPWPGDWGEIDIDSDPTLPPPE